MMIIIYVLNSSILILSQSVMQDILGSPLNRNLKSLHRVCIDTSKVYDALYLRGSL